VSDPDLMPPISFAALEAVSPQRQPGYVAEVLARAVRRTETDVYLTVADYLDLRARFATGEPAARTPFHALWAELHAATVLTAELIDSIAPRLPCGPCKSHWAAMLEATPPPIGEPAPAGRRWVTARHNEVNASLGRREWTQAESDARWTPTP
jgi:hypothetical protein